jgi:L-rhamnose mutarotase
MKRIGFVFKIRQDKLAEYKERHRAVWPEMLEALRRTGWHNYSLFLRDAGTVVGYFETPESFRRRGQNIQRSTKVAEQMAPMLPIARPMRMKAWWN